MRCMLIDLLKTDELDIGGRGTLAMNMLKSKCGQAKYHQSLS